MFSATSTEHVGPTRRSARSFGETAPFAPFTGPFGAVEPLPLTRVLSTLVGDKGPKTAIRLSRTAFWFPWMLKCAQTGPYGLLWAFSSASQLWFARSSPKRAHLIFLGSNKHIRTFTGSGPLGLLYAVSGTRGHWCSFRVISVVMRILFSTATWTFSYTPSSTLKLNLFNWFTSCSSRGYTRSIQTYARSFRSIWAFSCVAGP